MKKRIVLCADDYGQSPAISQGIVSLVKFGRLSATSCLVNANHWLEHAKWLIPLKSLSVGLHLNLTHGSPLSQEFTQAYGENFPTLATLLGRSMLRRLKKNVIEAEFDAQIDRFIEGRGELPSFVDGHQHIHQFPVIRDAFINVYKQRLEADSVYVRLVNEPIYRGDLFKNFKKLIILSTGAGAFKTLLELNNIPHNESFAGIYPFGKESTRYREWFIKFLQESEDGTVIMCHPALPADDIGDPIVAARYHEYQYLFGNQFLRDCYEQDVTLLTTSSTVQEESEVY